MPSSLTPTSLIGRRVDLLGRVQGVALGSASTGVQTTIFETNDLAFRGQSIYVAFVTVDLLAANPSFGGNLYAVITGTFDANVKLDLGSVGTTDWAGGTLNIGGQSSPVVCYASQAASGAFSLPQYGPQVLFTVVNRSTGASSQVGQVSAYGWSFG